MAVTARWLAVAPLPLRYTCMWV